MTCIHVLLTELPIHDNKAFKSLFFFHSCYEEPGKHCSSVYGPRLLLAPRRGSFRGNRHTQVCFRLLEATLLSGVKKNGWRTESARHAHVARWNRCLFVSSRATLSWWDG